MQVEKHQEKGDTSGVLKKKKKKYNEIKSLKVEQ